MPVKRRIDKRRASLTPEEIAWLNGSDEADALDVVYFHSDEERAALWRNHGPDVVAAHIAEWPGTRPLRWWTYDAPEKRRRIGGTGDVVSVGLSAVMVQYSKGVPSVGLARTASNSIAAT